MRMFDPMFDSMIKENDRFHKMINSHKNKSTAAKVSCLVIQFLIY